MMFEDQLRHRITQLGCSSAQEMTSNRSYVTAVKSLLYSGNNIYLESAGGVVVATSVSDAGDTGSIPCTGSCDIKIWLSTLGTVYPS